LSQEIDHTEKISLVLPSHAFEYDFHLRHSNEATSYGGNLLWGQTNMNLLGIGYLYDREQIKDDSVIYSLVLRRAGDNLNLHEHSVAFVYQVKDAVRQALTIKIDHPVDASRQIDFHVRRAH
jgi:hypothetical protein